MRRSLLLLIIAILFSVVLLIGYVHVQWYRDAVKHEEQSQVEMAQAVGWTFEEFVRDIRREEAAIGQGLISLPPASADQAHRFLKTRVGDYLTVRAFDWADLEGRIIASSDAAPLTENLRDEPFFDDILKGKDPIVTDLMPDFAGIQGPVFVIASGIRDEKKELVGVVLARVDPDRLGYLTLAMEPPERGRFTIFDQTGRLVFHNPPVKLTYEARDWLGKDPLLLLARSGGRPSGRMASPIDQESLIAARVPLPEIGWVAGASRPAGEVMRPVVQEFLVHVVVLVGGIASFSLLVIVVVNRRFSRSLAGLVAHAAAIGRGDLDHRADMHGTAEFQTLGEAFNQMAAKVRAARDDLEQRVNERTAQLRAANATLEAEIAERKEAERRTRIINSLLELFARTASRKEYLDSVIEVIRQWSGCECLGIRVVDSRGYIPYESYTGFPREFWQRENWLSLEADTCACVRIIKGIVEPQDAGMLTPGGSFRLDNSLAFVEGLAPEQRGRFRGQCMQNGYKSLAFIPIRYRGQVVGAIHLADAREALLPLAKIEFLESMAPLIGEAIQRFTAEEAALEQAALLDLAHDAIFVRDMDGRITFWNRGAENTYGWSKEEAGGKSPHELLRTEFPKPMAEIVETVTREGQWEGELVQHRRAGERHRRRRPLGTPEEQGGPAAGHPRNQPRHQPPQTGRGGTRAVPHPPGGTRPPTHRRTPGRQPPTPGRDRPAPVGGRGTRPVQPRPRAVRLRRLARPPGTPAHRRRVPAVAGAPVQGPNSTPTPTSSSGSPSTAPAACRT